MAIVKAVASAAMGVLLVYAGVGELRDWFRARSRLLRVPGVTVGSEEVLGRGPGVHNRSARFRFTTDQGKVIDKESSFYSFPGPKPGKRVTVSYDPERPWESAEIAWVARMKVLFSPLLAGGGIAFLVLAATYL